MHGRVQMGQTVTKHVQAYALLANNGWWSIRYSEQLHFEISSTQLFYFTQWPHSQRRLASRLHNSSCSDTDNHEESLTTLSIALAKYSTFLVFKPAMLIRPFLVM